MMELELVPVLEEDKNVLYYLYQFYEYDFTQYTEKDLNNFGRFDVSLEHYWQDPRWNPFIICYLGQIVGFVVVLFEDYDVDPDPTHVIYDFFIIRKYRRKGLGKLAAIKAFDLYKANWKTAQMSNNEPAIFFWRKVVSQYTSGSFNELHRQDIGKYVQSFSTKES
jgi:predicted acetyltransferase